MAFVRTVLGDINASELGVCYAHEHVIIDPSFATEVDPSFLLDDVDRAADELGGVYALGVRAMIDTMPGGAGRNASKLAKVSRQSGIHLIAPTGMHLAKYYRDDDPLLKLDVNALAAWFADEIQHGLSEAESIDGHRSRAGVIKVASGRDRLSPHERGVFDAAAIAHRATGCPIITHTEQGTAAMEQVDRLLSAGVDPSRLTLSHTDRLPDASLHRELLRRGVKLEYDSAFRWKPADGNPTLRLVVELAAEFPSQLMLGMDAARRSYWSSYGGSPGLGFLWATFRDQLGAAGVSETLLEQIFIANPAEAYSFVNRP